MHEMKAYNISFLFDIKSLLYTKLVPYEAMNLTSSDYPIQQSYDGLPFCLR